VLPHEVSKPIAVEVGCCADLPTQVGNSSGAIREEQRRREPTADFRQLNVD
jgi:hypothetical protein